MSRKSHEHYTAEFKAEAIKLVLEEPQGITTTAKRLGIANQTLSTWVLKARSARLVNTNQPKPPNLAWKLRTNALNKRLHALKLSEIYQKKPRRTSQAKVCEVRVNEVVSVSISNCSNESRTGSLI